MALPTISPVAIVLAISVAANVFVGRAYLAERDTATTATHQRDQARSDATACSDATEDLRDLANKRAKAAAPARAAAASAAQGLQARADYTLRLRPKDPADMCASMQALGDEWLQGRAQK
jgi:hypothetical protein